MRFSAYLAFYAATSTAFAAGLPPTSWRNLRLPRRQAPPTAKSSSPPPLSLTLAPLSLPPLKPATNPSSAAPASAAPASSVAQPAPQSNAAASTQSVTPVRSSQPAQAAVPQTVIPARSSTPAITLSPGKATTALPRAATQLPAPTVGKVLHAFSNGTGIQALAVRPNGQLIVALSDQPEIYAMDPQSSTAKLELVHRFAKGTRVITLAEYAPDRFAVLAADASRSTESAATLWTLRLDSLSGASTKRVAEVWEGTNFVSLSKFTGADMFAAHVQGSVYLLNVNSGSLRGLFTDPTMETTIGGIRYHEPHVYWVNRDQGLFARIQVGSNGEAVAPVETIASDVVGVSDFALAPWTEHVAYLVNYEQGQILKVDESANVTEAASGWPAPVVGQFGRGDVDSHTLYVGTGGALGMAGKVLSIPV